MEITVDIMKVWSQIREIVTSPKKFFESARSEKSWKKALPFLIVTAGVGHILTAIYNIVFSPNIPSEVAESFGITDTTFSVAEVIPAVIISYLLTILMSFVWGAALKFWLSIFRVDSSFAQAYKVMVYSRGPNYLLSWLPFVNFFVAIYSFYLLGVGLMKEYSISRNKAILIIASSILVIALLLVVLLSVVPSV